MKGAKGRWGAIARILVSGVLVGVLVYIAIHKDVFSQLKKADPQWVAAGFLLLAAGWVLNSVRWWMLLRVVGVRENPATLASLYFIGMFFSQLLPTGAGGDPVRMLALYRRGHKPAPVIVATLQERLMGMGVSMLVGLAMVGVYWSRLPAAALPFLVAVPIGAVAAVGIFLYPRLPMRLAARLPMAGRLKHLRPVQRLAAAIAPAAELPALIPGRLLPIALVTLGGDLLTMGTWYVLGRAVGLAVPFGGFCLIVPMVWVISMAPSLGGAGVREGGFVWLTKLFAAPLDKSVACAALYLIVQLVLSALGGVLLLASMWSGGRAGSAQKKPDGTNNPPGLH